MIKLFSRHCMVVERDGRRRSLACDEIRRRLERCFCRCGVDGAWLAEDVAMIVEEQVEQRSREEGEELLRSDVDAMVATVLSASGYADVAREYQRSLELGSADLLPASLFAWDSCRVARLLTGVAALPEESVATWVPRVCDALRTLGLTRVSDEFIRQVGIHLAHGTAPRSDSPFLSLPALSAYLPASQAEWFAGGILRLRPVSRLVPRVRLDVDVVRLAENLGSVPLTELQVLPGMARAFRAAASCLSLVRAEVSRLRPSAEKHPSRVSVCGVDRVTGEYLGPLSRRAARAFERDVRRLAERELAAVGSSFELLVTVR